MEIIKSVYIVLCKDNPSKDEIKARIDQNISLRDLIEDVLYNDSRSVYVKETSRLVGELMVAQENVEDLTKQLKECGIELSKWQQTSSGSTNPPDSFTVKQILQLLLNKWFG